jgi:PAS domain S-box-containing protein
LVYEKKFCFFHPTFLFNHPMEELELLRKKLAESQQMLQLILDTIPMSIFWKDRNSVYLGCNRVFAIDAGLEYPAQIMGKTDYDLAWSRDQSDFFRHTDMHVMTNRTPQYHIIQHQRSADGRYYWVDTNKLPLINVEGIVTGVLGIEDKLRLSQEPFDFDTETVQVGTWMWHSDTNELDLDDNLLDILGITTQKHRYYLEDWLQMVEPQYRTWVQQAMQEHFSGLSSSYEQRYTILTPTGQKRWILVRGNRIYDTNDEVEQISGTVANITALQQAEERFAQSERTQANLAEVLRETAELLAYSMRNQNAHLMAPVPTMTSFLLESTSPRPLFKLTNREHEILRYLVQGQSNAQMAAYLNISLFTVKNHVSSLLTKLGTKSRAEAVSLALREKIV